MMASSDNSLHSFRQGKMYQYTAGEYDPESLSNYMAGQFANTAPQDIPLPKSPL